MFNIFIKKDKLSLQNFQHTIFVCVEARALRYFTFYYVILNVNHFVHCLIYF